MPELSILIPARNEMFLGITIENILKNIEGDTEVIAVLDGYTDKIPKIPSDPRVRVLYNPESIGQRAATNQACRYSSAKYVMKVDAHCAFDKGFDVKMMQEMHDDWTMIPTMFNLHAFDWVCDCGNRRYQGPKTPCEKCNKEMKMEVIWKEKTNPRSNFFRFDNTLHFQYWGELGKRPGYEGDIAETMSIQGSCFMLTRDKYWELNICDEAHGSWGQQGTEISCSTHLSGGRLVVNKKTWYAHMFRTQADFGFPYPNPGISKAREYSRKLWLENSNKSQIYPLSWLLEKFSPIEGWSSEAIEEQFQRELSCPRPGIYSIINLENGKTYIGSAKNLSRRFSEHRRELKRNAHSNGHLQNSWNTHGENSFLFKVLYFCEESQLLSYEQNFIDECVRNIGQDMTYNINLNASSGLGRKHTIASLKKMSLSQSKERNGFYGKKHTIESRKQMSASKIGMTPWNLGIPCSPETKEKISKAATGRIISQETRKKLSDAGKGRIMSDETKEKLKSSPRFSGRTHSEETKRKISAALKGRIFTEEDIKKNSDGVLAYWARKRVAGLPSKGILYYTDSELDPKIMNVCKDQLIFAADQIKIVSVSLKPMELGENLVLPLLRGTLTMFKQILAGLKALDTDIVFFAEHDVLYSPEHFKFTPTEKGTFYYNNNHWRLRLTDGYCVHFDHDATSGLCGFREDLIKEYEERVRRVEAEGFNNGGFEPGTRSIRRGGFSDSRSKRWEASAANIDIRHGANLTRSKWKPEDFRNQRSCRNWKVTDDILTWGKTTDLIKLFDK